MVAVRQRKLLEDNGEQWAAERTREKKPRQSPANKSNKPKRFFIFVVLISLSTLIIGSYTDTLPWSISRHATNALDNIAYSLGLQKHVYAVVIDAGSTGSRVLAFTFHESVIDKNLKLDDELFVQVKPGLSSFVDNPKKGAESLQELLDRAKSVIPAAEWSKAPLAMKATAGLRLLPEKKASELLREVEELFSKSPFLTNKNSVSIMDGVDEGLFSWFTVNFLMDRLSGNPAKTVAALDLGGGSTQITFVPTEEETLKHTKPEYLHHITAFHHNLSVYTNSYLGLGLMAARKEILTTGNKDSVNLRSECINPIISDANFKYAGVEYKISGPEKPSFKIIKATANVVGEKRPIVNFTICSQLIKNYVAHKVDRPAELNNKEINAFSYYFDRATEFGLIDPFKGGVVTVGQFLEAAQSSCMTPNTDQPFECLDLTFISVLLKDGFGLGSEKKLNLFKKIDNHEISWALGAAFHILQNGL